MRTSKLCKRLHDVSDCYSSINRSNCVENITRLMTALCVLHCIYAKNNYLNKVDKFTLCIVDKKFVN